MKPFNIYRYKSHKIKTSPQAPTTTHHPYNQFTETDLVNSNTFRPFQKPPLYLVTISPLEEKENTFSDQSISSQCNEAQNSLIQLTQALQCLGLCCSLRGKHQDWNKWRKKKTNQKKCYLGREVFFFFKLQRLGQWFWEVILIYSDMLKGNKLHFIECPAVNALSWVRGDNKEEKEDSQGCIWLWLEAERNSNGSSVFFFFARSPKYIEKKPSTFSCNKKRLTEKSKRSLL